MAHSRISGLWLPSLMLLAVVWCVTHYEGAGEESSKHQVGLSANHESSQQTAGIDRHMQSAPVPSEKQSPVDERTNAASDSADDLQSKLEHMNVTSSIDRIVGGDYIERNQFPYFSK